MDIIRAKKLLADPDQTKEIFNAVVAWLRLQLKNKKAEIKELQRMQLHLKSEIKKLRIYE